MSQTRWWTYVTAVAGEVQNKDVADRAGIDKSNVTRWSQGSRPAVEFVLKFARAYDQPVVAALAEAGYITDSEARIREVKVGVEDLSILDLARELHSRLERSESANVTHAAFRHRSATSVSPEALSAVAKKKSRDRGGDDGQG